MFTSLRESKKIASNPFKLFSRTKKSKNTYLLQFATIRECPCPFPYSCPYPAMSMSMFMSSSMSMSMMFIIMFMQHGHEDGYEHNQKHEHGQQYVCTWICIRKCPYMYLWNLCMYINMKIVMDMDMRQVHKYVRTVTCSETLKIYSTWTWAWTWICTRTCTRTKTGQETEMDSGQGQGQCQRHEEQQQQNSLNTCTTYRVLLHVRTCTSYMCM
jgi:hypothetical protein